MSELKVRIESLINSEPIFLFMKGTPEMPQCGFSANVVKILNGQNIKFGSFNILTDMDIREGVKAYSNWPTYPQLYVKGELIGGNDIVMEMMASGELEKLFVL
jgi:monothiol glutaredoxin